MKKLLLCTGVLVVLAGLSLLPATAEAVCVKVGHEVARVDFVASTGVSNIFLRANSLAGASFFAVTNNPNVIAMASTAVHHRTRVTVQGNAASCPTSGSIGTVVIFQLAQP